MTVKSRLLNMFRHQLGPRRSSSASNLQVSVLPSLTTEKSKHTDKTQADGLLDISSIPETHTELPPSPSSSSTRSQPVFATHEHNTSLPPSPSLSPTSTTPSGSSEVTTTSSLVRDHDLDTDLVQVFVAAWIWMHVYLHVTLLHALTITCSTVNTPMSVINDKRVIRPHIDQQEIVTVSSPEKVNPHAHAPQLDRQPTLPKEPTSELYRLISLPSTTWHDKDRKLLRLAEHDRRMKDFWCTPPIVYQQRRCLDNRRTEQGPTEEMHPALLDLIQGVFAHVHQHGALSNHLSQLAPRIETVALGSALPHINAV